MYGSNSRDSPVGRPQACEIEVVSAKHIVLYIPVHVGKCVETKLLVIKSLEVRRYTRLIIKTL